MVGQYSVADQAVEQDATKITVGEALEATALAAGERPVDRTDVEAIRAAEMAAQGSDVTMPGGLADQAQAAVRSNADADRDDDKITVGDVLTVRQKKKKKNPCQQQVGSTSTNGLEL